MKPAPLILQAYAISDVGRRKNNEDTYLINREIGLFLVADGMGGHSKGDVASRFTSGDLERILSVVDGNREDTLDEVSLSSPCLDHDDLILHAVHSINMKLYADNEKEAAKYANAANPPEEGSPAAMMARKCQMGTTLVSLFIRGNRGYLTHLGDSRAYRIGEGKIHRLTEDHSWVGERVHSGEISAEEAKTHKKRNLITRSVGIKQNVIAEMDVLTIHPPEKYLLCSDGLCGVVDNESLLKLCQTENLKEACEQMVALAKEKGSKDNITALLIDVATGNEWARGDDMEKIDETLP